MMKTKITPTESTPEQTTETIIATAYDYDNAVRLAHLNIPTSHLAWALNEIDLQFGQE